MGIDSEDSGLYPSHWDEFIGQKQAKVQLMTAITVAKKRQRPLEHILIASGTPGLGKTALALLVIGELGVRYRVQSGIVRPDDLISLFVGMEDGDCLLLDEVHRLADGGGRGGKNAEWLLHYLQDGILITPLGPEKVPRCTVIATTTEAGRLPPAVLQRFQITPVIKPYSDDEAAQIAWRLAARVLGDEGLTLPSLECCLRMAKASNNKPRIMRRLLVNLRNLVIAGGVDDDADYDLETALEWTGLTPDGLSEAACRYLTTVYEKFEARPVGRAMISSLIREGGHVIAEVEEDLQARGMLAWHGTSGRRLTFEGINRAHQLGALRRP